MSHSPPGANLLHADIRLTMTAQQLNGSQRVLLDGVITDDECRELQRLSNVSQPRFTQTSAKRTSVMEWIWLYSGAKCIKSLKLLLLGYQRKCFRTQ